mmetsp:Transcript_21143/g.50267  ORF Transcript_21143/g.50267 Transcript_21143/m.50267 type:complete len:326 (-) Transcript_21143:1624-2601(-)
MEFASVRCYPNAVVRGHRPRRHLKRPRPLSMRVLITQVIFPFKLGGLASIIELAHRFPNGAKLIRAFTHAMHGVLPDLAMRSLNGGSRGEGSQAMPKTVALADVLNHPPRARPPLHRSLYFHGVRGFGFVPSTLLGIRRCRSVIHGNLRIRRQSSGGRGLRSHGGRGGLWNGTRSCGTRPWLWTIRRLSRKVDHTLRAERGSSKSASTTSFLDNGHFAEVFTIAAPIEHALNGIQRVLAARLEDPFHSLASDFLLNDGLHETELQQQILRLRSILIVAHAAQPPSARLRLKTLVISPHPYPELVGAQGNSFSARELAHTTPVVLP